MDVKTKSISFNYGTDGKPTSNAIGIYSWMLGRMLAGTTAAGGCGERCWFSGKELKDIVVLDAKVAELTDVPVDIAFVEGGLKLLDNAVEVVGKSVVEVRK